jgi:hypothetical protein
VQAKARETAEVVAANAPANVLSDPSIEWAKPRRRMSLVDKARMEGEEKAKEFAKMTADEKTKYVLESNLILRAEWNSKAQQETFCDTESGQIGQAIMNTYASANKGACVLIPAGINFCGNGSCNGSC